MTLDAAADLVIWANVVASLLMTGVVLFVAVVHYPLFARVGEGAFLAYEKAHQARTTLVVAPLMLAEVLLGAALLWLREGPLPWVNLALVGATWGITFGISVPQHARLASGLDGPARGAVLRALVGGTGSARRPGWRTRGCR